MIFLSEIFVKKGTGMSKKILLLSSIVVCRSIQAADEHYLLQTLCNSASNGYSMQTWPWLIDKQSL